VQDLSTITIARKVATHVARNERKGVSDDVSLRGLTMDDITSECVLRALATAPPTLAPQQFGAYVGTTVRRYLKDRDTSGDTKRDRMTPLPARIEDRADSRALADFAEAEAAIAANSIIDEFEPAFRPALRRVAFDGTGIRTAAAICGLKKNLLERRIATFRDSAPGMALRQAYGR
jgi:DNA-directed RNA polymerase specialized sigma24 family protein